MSKFSSFIAKRYLWSKRSEAFITILTIISITGVALGVAVLNITMSIMTGFETTLKEKIVGANSHITIRKVGGSMDQWKAVRDLVFKVPDVTSVSPFTYNQALLKVENKSVGILIRGIQKESASSDELQADTVNDPEAVSRMFSPEPVSVFTESGKADSVVLPGIIIGKELSVNYGLSKGDIVSLLSSQVASTPMGLLPKFKRFVVAGVYSSGLIEYESGVAYMPMNEAQLFFKLADDVTGLEVKIKDLNKSSEVTQAITQAVSGEIGGPIYAQDWSEQNKPLWEAIRMEKRVYFIVLLLLVVLASFSIISTLVMLVLEKRKDIAVLKTLGATDASIARIFRTQGAAIGAIGTLSGLLLGYVGCKILQAYGFPLDERIFQMSQVPVKIDLVNFLVVGVSSFVICFLSTWYPSKRAASLHPSEILRGT
jgi:lipoprotein-releasing system permease protein